MKKEDVKNYLSKKWTYFYIEKRKEKRERWILIDGIEYGFKVEVNSSTIIANIPVLKNILRRGWTYFGVHVTKGNYEWTGPTTYIWTM